MLPLTIFSVGQGQRFFCIMQKILASSIANYKLCVCVFSPLPDAYTYVPGSIIPPTVHSWQTARMSTVNCSDRSLFCFLISCETQDFACSLCWLVGNISTPELMAIHYRIKNKGIKDEREVVKIACPSCKLNQLGCSNVYRTGTLERKVLTCICG